MHICIIWVYARHFTLQSRKAVVALHSRVCKKLKAEFWGLTLNPKTQNFGPKP